MVLLKKNGHNYFVAVGERIIEYNYETEFHRVRKIAEPRQEIPSANEVQALNKEDRSISSICCSGKYLAAVTESRKLVVFDGDDVIDSVILPRAASRVRFAADENSILIADKTGDAYLYKLGSDRPELLLGHLSMLLDVTLSNCGNYVITCDRDEKIRVSHFPNAYNIQNFCLGHAEFVTNLEVIGDILISSSGDGTIRCWDCINGLELKTINTNDHIEDKNLIDKFCKSMDLNKVEVSAVPVTDMQVFQNKTIFIGVSLYASNFIQLYNFSTHKQTVQIDFIQNIKANDEIISFNLSDKLCVLTVVGFLLFNLNNNKYELGDPGNFNNILYNNYKTLFENYCIHKNVPILYKRKFDNVNEYLEKKKLRMGN